MKEVGPYAFLQQNSAKHAACHKEFNFHRGCITARRGDLEHQRAGECPMRDGSQVDSQRWVPEALGGAP